KGGVAAPSTRRSRSLAAQTGWLVKTANRQLCSFEFVGSVNLEFQDVRNQKRCVMDTVEIMRPILKSQYHAALAMLRDAVERCPDRLWASGDYRNPFWRIAYHVLYYTDFYLQPNADSFRPWEKHQTGIQFMDDLERPANRASIGELPHRPSRTGEPYKK